MAWQKGQSGNPNGRPPAGRAFAEALRKVGEEEGNLEAVAEKVWELARDGDLRAIALLAERLDGRPLSYGDEEAMRRAERLGFWAR